MKLLIERGVDVNSLSEVSMLLLLLLLFTVYSLFILVKGVKGYGWTPLVHAATKGHLEICQILLEHGSAVDPKEVAQIFNQFPPS